MGLNLFNQNPQITPIPPSGAWIYPMGGNAANLLNVTTANSSTAVTVNSPGTSMLAIGQTISGLNIAPGTTIAALPSSSSITLSQNTLSSGAGTGNVNVQGLPGQQSAVFGNFQFYGFPSPAAQAADILGCPFYIPESQSLLANGTFIPSPGAGWLSLTSGTTAATVQIQTSAGSWTTIFTGTVSVAVFVRIETDGGNVRFNFPTTAGSFIYYRYRAIPSF